MKRVVKIAGILLIVYLAVGYLFHMVIFPQRTPDVLNYFQPGDVLYSEKGGNTMTILAQDGDIVHMEMTLLPFADGPPVHYHNGFDETFIVESGTLTILADGVEHILEPGEQITIPKGMVHKPYNPTADTVVVRGDIPVEFAVYLNQVYGYMDESEKNMRPPKVILQMAMFGNRFDSHRPEDPPLLVRKPVNFMIVPLARLLGYRSYYEQYGLNRPSDVTELNNK